MAQVCEALATARGNIAVAAASLGVSRRTVERRIERHESCRQARDDARQQTTDIVEGRLEERAINGDPWAVTFYLSTRARDRGYGNRTELTGPNGGPQQHEVRTTVSMGEKTDEELDEIIARATLHVDSGASEG
mgnify:FL=1